MDKVHMKGRLSIAVAVAVCLLMVMLPTMAFAATSFGSSYPAGTLHGQPGQIGITVVSTPQNIVGGILNIDGSPAGALLTKRGTTKGVWTPSWVETPVGSGLYIVNWTWVAGSTAADTYTLYTYPATTLAQGLHTITGSATDASGTTTAFTAFTFTIAGSPVVVTPPGSATPVNGCATGCHDPNAGYATAPLMGPNCSVCHTGIDAPPHGFFSGAHTHADLAAGMGNTSNTSYACASCHGTDLTSIQLVTGEHAGCSCHNYHEATDAVTGCADCHKGAYGPHGFAAGNASGHNTTSYGQIGAWTKFDGTGGSPVLTWKATQAFTVTAIKDPSAVSVTPGTSFSAGATGTVTSTWAFPTKSVFWDSASAADATATAVVVTQSSTITCLDCHTGLTAAGPHGEAQNWGIDPAYPGDYSMAGLTKKVTSGVTMPSGAYSKSGIYEAASASSTRTTALSRFQATTLWTDGTKGPTAVICAKCHKLETSIPAYSVGAGETSRTPGKSGQLWDVVVGANTAHNSHHQDTNDGTSQCVSCHVAIPHGWKAPRLLIDIPTLEAAGGSPMISENAVEDMGTLSAFNNHPLIPSSGQIPYSSSNGSSYLTTDGAQFNPSLSGTVEWDESQCDACGDHYGNRATWANPTTWATTTTPNVPGYTVQTDTGVQARIQ